MRYFVIDDDFKISDEKNSFPFYSFIASSKL